MSVRLPSPPPGYSLADQSETRRALEQALRRTHNKGEDIEVGVARLILTSPNGTRYSVTVDNSGTLSATAI